jgi:hypothetical protein
LLCGAHQDRKCCPPEDLSLCCISFCGGCGGIFGGGSGGISGGTCGGGSSGGCSGGYTGGSRGGGSSRGRSNGSSTGGWGGCCWALVTICLIVSAKGLGKTNGRFCRRDSSVELMGCQTIDPGVGEYPEPLSARVAMFRAVLASEAGEGLGEDCWLKAAVVGSARKSVRSNPILMATSQTLAELK